MTSESRNGYSWFNVSSMVEILRLWDPNGGLQPVYPRRETRNMPRTFQPSLGG